MLPYHPIIQNLKTDGNYQLDLLRLDLVHPAIGGNKWFKLKYNIKKAIIKKKGPIITFGGAFSNHIAATASSCKIYNLKSVGIIRGEENQTLNPTLLKAKENGMSLHFVSREFYSQKNSEQFKNWLNEKFGEHYLLPEGGNNKEGVLGCAEILKSEWDHDYIVCACGTGTTYSGISGASKPGQKTIGISVLKGENKLVSETEELIHLVFPNTNVKVSGNEELKKEYIENNCITDCYSFNGYAKYNEQLVGFKKEFETEYKIPLDYIYTNKLIYAVFDLIKKRKFKPGSKILMIHSGGLQGNKSFEERYRLIPTL